MKDKITTQKLDKYFKLTSKALKQAKKKISSETRFQASSPAHIERIKEKEDHAKEIIEMVENYLSDAKHFESKKDYVNAFAALNYAHGWLDSGVRLDVFNVKDDKLFTVK